MYDTDLGELSRIPVNPKYKEYGVARPKKSNVTITYEVTARNNSGEMIVEHKRFSDFHLLRTTLVQRWPGFYIPATPPKQTFVSEHGSIRKGFILMYLLLLSSTCTHSFSVSFFP